MRRILSALCAVLILLSVYIPVSAKVSAEGTVLYDRDGIRITRENDYWNAYYDDYCINLEIKNDSAYNISVYADEESVNGYVVSGVIYSHVKSGEKATAQLRFDKDDLIQNYIRTITDIEFCLQITEDSDDEDRRYRLIGKTDPVHLTVDPISLGDDIAEDIRPITPFYDKDGIRISYINRYFNEENDLVVNLLMENNSDVAKWIHVDYGYFPHPTCHLYGLPAYMAWRVVAPGKKAYTSMRFTEYCIKNTHILSTDEIHFTPFLFTESDSRYSTGVEIGTYTITQGGVEGYTTVPNPNTQTSVSAAEAYSHTATVLVNGNTVRFDVPPTVQNGRTLVPMRAIFEALGADVSWNEDSQSVLSNIGDTFIFLTVGKNEMMVDGTLTTLDVPPVILNNRTFVPVRAISEAFNCSVEWDASVRTVRITTR